MKPFNLEAAKSGAPVVANLGGEKILQNLIKVEEEE